MRGESHIFGSHPFITGNAKILGHATIYGSSIIYGNAKVFDSFSIYPPSSPARTVPKSRNDFIWYKVLGCEGHPRTTFSSVRIYFFSPIAIYGNAKVFDYSFIMDSIVCGNSRVYENAYVIDGSVIQGNARVHGEIRICNHSLIGRNADLYGDMRIEDDILSD